MTGRAQESIRYERPLSRNETYIVMSASITTSSRVLCTRTAITMSPTKPAAGVYICVRAMRSVSAFLR